MKTVLALIDHPNLDIIIGPVLIKLLEKNVNLKVIVAHAGKANYFIKNNIAYQTNIDMENEFFNLPGQKLFLNAADQNVPAHANGRKLDAICRTKGIPSFTLEHSTLFNNHPAYWKESYLFDADKMAIIGQSDHDGFSKLGVPSERLVITGFPPFDEYFEYAKNNSFTVGNYIWVAGQNHSFFSGNRDLVNGLTRQQWTATLNEMYKILLNNFPNYKILIKPHPAEPYHNTVNLYKDAIPPDCTSKIEVLDHKHSNIQGISNAAFVASFSPSVAFESIILKKKVLFLAIRKLSDSLKEAEKFGAMIIETTPSNIATDISHKLAKCVQEIKEGSLYALDVPNEYIEKYLYKFDGKAAERIAAAVLEMMQEEKSAPITSDISDARQRRPIFKEMGFERYMRLMGVAEEADLNCDGTYTLLDIGSHDDVFKKFLPKVTYSSYNGFITKNKKAPFDDKSYDIVIATDVLEHVTPEDRKAFILELLRLAKRKVVFSFPTQQAGEFEKFALTLIPGHRWLKEHIDQGLPAKADIDNILDEARVSYTVKFNHALASWICSLILEFVNFDNNVKLRINEFLQSNCFEMEKREPAYRYIYTININRDFDKEKISDSFEGRQENSARPPVSIIIPLFNKVEFTRKCLDALFQNTPDCLYELILIDNGSTDETKTFLQARAKDNIKIITNEKNLGFAKSCNQGAQAASTKYLLFLNNDTEPQKGWLEPLLAIIKNDDSVVAVGSKLLYPDMTIQHAGVVIVNDKAGHDALQARNNYVNKPATWPGANEPTLYQALTAACVLIDNKAFLEAGGFDEEYWNGYEDVDLCFKLQEQGGKLVYQPASVVIHHESKSGPERFAKALDNIALLHKKWLGKIKPDVILNEDGTFSRTDTGKIQLYHAPITAKPSLKPALMPMINNLVSIVILTFNQLEYTKKCVKSLQKHTPEEHEIIFIDNGSTDGTVQWLKTQAKNNKNYKLIENKQNLGFAKGCNQGIETSRGEFILLLNNDVVVARGWLTGLLDCLQHAPAAGIVGPMTNNISGPQQINDDAYRSVDYLDKYAAKFQERHRHRRIPLRRIVGFCMLFKRSLTEQIGMLDESFGTGNFEDDDLCLRAVLAGYRNYIAGDIFIHHYGSRSFIGNKINYGASISDNRKIIDKKWTLRTSSSEGKKLAVLRATELADDFYSKGKIDQAVETLVDCIKLTPEAKEIYYELARIFLESRKFAEARDVVASMPEAAKNSLKGMACAGYAKEGLGLDDEAAAYAEKILSSNPMHPAALNLKGVLAYKKGKKEEAENYFQKAIHADPGYGEAHTNLGVLYWGTDKKDDALFHLKKGFRLSPTIPDVNSIYYSIISSLGMFNDAETDFQEALKLYPGNRNLHFLYIDILIRGDKFDSAIIKIEDTLALFGPDTETLNAALAVREKIGPVQIEKSSGKGTLSLCMIVKNEEKNLIRCLKSVRDVVDEIIIVDTGSTDKTIDIAKVFGARVFDFPWTGDFSEARNQSLAHATGDWILVLDADEAVSPRDFDELKNLIHKRTSSPVAYAIVTRNYMNNTSVIGWTPKEGKYPEEAGAGWTTSTKVRLLPRRKDVFFSNPVHELLEGSLKSANIPVRQCKIIVHHYGKLDRVREAQKDEDYYLLGRIKYESDPTNLKSIYELAKQAHLLKKYDEAVELWLKLLSLIETDHASASYQEIAKISYDDPLPEIYIQLASAYLLLDRFEEALITSLKAMESRVKRKEYVVIYAHCEVMAGSLEKAFRVLDELAGTTPDYPPAMLLTAVIFCLEGKKEQARELFQLLWQKSVHITSNLNKFAKQFYAYGKKNEALLILNAVMENKLNDGETSALLEEFQKAEVK